MIHVDRAVTVDRPPATVFDYLSDLEHFASWQPAIERVEQLDPGAVGPGTRFRLVLRAPTGRIDALGEVVAFERPALLAIRSLNGPAQLEARCEVAPEAAGSRLRLVADIALGGMFRFAEGMVRDRIEAELPATLDGLARRVETETR
jgi:uncharacterized protein YndB with AHSA1/START domain